MEGVGARLGRSSTRYGPATVFNGAVRKWKKKWVHVAPSSAASNNNTTANHSHQIHNQNNKSNATTNGINGSHLLLYKWTPITQSNNGNNSNGDRNSGKDEAAAALEEPPRRKFKYIPIAVLEEQNNEDSENEAAEKVDDDSESIDTAAESTPRGEVFDEKPDINDLPMEESQENNQVVCQDLNESTLDLSLGFKGHDGDHEPDSKTGQKRYS